MGKFIKAKNLIWLLGFSAVLLLPSFASAATVEELQAMINSLMQQIASLQAQIVAQQGGATAWCHDFNADLKIGMGGSHVKALQIALGKDGFPAMDIEENTQGRNYFGEITASAVTGFQQKYAGEILTPLGLKFGTGFVGPATRAKLNKFYGCGIIIPPTPTISSISPSSGTQDTDVFNYELTPKS